MLFSLKYSGYILKLVYKQDVGGVEKSEIRKEIKT
jgi:hypothetical protein